MLQFLTYIYDNTFQPTATNKKKPGFFKDETGGCPIKECVGLRSKMYSFTFMNEEKKESKGNIENHS